MFQFLLIMLTVFFQYVQIPMNQNLFQKKIIESRVGACPYAIQFFSGPPSYGS